MLRIICKGCGYLVVVFTVVFVVTANAIAASVTGNDVYWKAHRWPLAAGFLAAGLACGLTGYLLSRRKARVLVDPQTGEEVVLRQLHTLFFIPMTWWGSILTVFALLLLSVEFVK